MKNNIILMLCLILTIMVFTPCLSQDFHYPGPEETDRFFAIGWSADGKLFAHGLFMKRKIGSFEDAYFEHWLIIEVHSLVADSCLFSVKQIWKDNDKYFPADAKQAWTDFSSDYEINIELRNAGITVLSSRGVFISEEPGSASFPFSHEEGDGMIEIRKSDCSYHDGYGADDCVFSVYVSKNNLGEKKINTFGGWDEFPIYVFGYVLNPDQSRMAVIIHQYHDYMQETDWEKVIGCHMRAGFKMNMK